MAKQQAEIWDAVVVGAGPAGLRAAETLGAAGYRVLIADAKPSVARKFLMAGKSGLNLTKDEPREQLQANYGDKAAWLAPMLAHCSAQEVQDWARGLGVTLFSGSTGRVFPVEMKASPLLRAWLSRLDSYGVERRTRWRWQGWTATRFCLTPWRARNALMPAARFWQWAARVGRGWGQMGPGPMS